MTKAVATSLSTSPMAASRVKGRIHGGTKAVVHHQKSTTPARSTTTSAAGSSKPARSKSISKSKASSTSPPPLPATTRRPKGRDSGKLPTVFPLEDGRQVWLATATVPQVQAARRELEQSERGRRRRRRTITLFPHAPPNRLFLIQLASPTLRYQVYQEAAAAWQDLEERVLPHYGGRPWQVQVSLVDPSPPVSAMPLFCWHSTGYLELAAWPHWLQAKMPDPPKFPGYYSSAKEAAMAQQKRLKQQQRRQKQQQEKSEDDQSGNAQSDGVSHVNREEDVHFEDDLDDAEEELTPDQRLLDLQERQPSPLSELAWQLRTRFPLPTVQIKWISPLQQTFASRKSAWEHALQLCQKEVLLDHMLAGVTSTGKPVSQLASPPALARVVKAGKFRFERDGLWVVGQETLWMVRRWQEKGFDVISDCWGNLADGVDSNTVVADAAAWMTTQGKTQQLQPPQSTTGRPWTGLSYYIHCRRHEYREERQRLFDNNLQPTSTNSDQEMNGERTDLQQGTSPMPSHVRNVEGDSSDASASSAWNQATGNSECEKGDFVEKLVSADDRHFIMNDSGCTKAKDLVGKRNSSSAPSPPKLPKGSYILTLRDAERELREIWKTLPSEEQDVWKQKAALAQQEQQLCGTRNDPRTARDDENMAYLSLGPSTAVEDVEDVSNGAATTIEPSISPPGVAATLAERTMSTQTGRVVATATAAAVAVTPCTLSDSDECTTRAPLHHDVDEATLPVPIVSDAQSNTVGIANIKKKPIHLHIAGPSSRWRLNEEQIRLCYNAGMDHFNQIMRTVKARDLTRELQDGFDLLRERGRGRFDMELPAFDEPSFDFLTHIKKAPWMPVVRAILGKDVALIHKGMFLSLPGAEAQVYHQDGTHLSTQCQKPCHAINVFVPLVNMTLRHGPTEFCLGSHILGHEEYDRRFVESPCVAAGTPIIFDYRLGHRGLGNTTHDACRPIVYCTYAASGQDGRKEFRDLVNFSRKRYHRIGDLVGAAPGREERARKRERLVEEQVFQRALEESVLSEYRVSTIQQGSTTRRQEHTKNN